MKLYFLFTQSLHACMTMDHGRWGLLEVIYIDENGCGKKWRQNCWAMDLMVKLEWLLVATNSKLDSVAFRSEVIPKKETFWIDGFGSSQEEMFKDTTWPCDWNWSGQSKSLGPGSLC